MGKLFGFVDIDIQCKVISILANIGGGVGGLGGGGGGGGDRDTLCQVD